MKINNSNISIDSWLYNEDWFFNNAWLVALAGCIIVYQQGRGRVISRIKIESEAVKFEVHGNLLRI